MKISIILPIKNEEKNIPLIYAEIMAFFAGRADEYEIICVNDGSTDDSFKALKKLALENNRLKIINFKYNFGQTAGLSAGIKEASGEIIIPLDADMQNDPKDLPLFIDKLNEGFDVVSGWRKNRWQGSFLSRKLPSILANKLISLITKTNLHDYGCTMKAYKREAIQSISLYGQMHRFIPAYIKWQGGKVAEVVVNDRPRKFGQTNYGMSRTFKVLLDLVVIKFLFRYMNRPMHFFGGVGFMSFAIGVFAGLLAVLLKAVHSRDFVETPLPIFSALFLIVGVQLVAMGIIAEMIMRTYYESQNKTPYIVKEKINF